MTREESKMMQGMAILIMIFFHLFNPHDAPEYSGTIIGRMAMGSNPVPFYVILSGYGLYKSYIYGGGRSNLKRITTLYLHYWCIMSLFILISYMAGNHRCHLTTLEFVANYSGWKSTYYLPSWFILPYCILIGVSSYLFKTIDYLGNIKSLIGAYLIYIAMAYLTRNTFFQTNAIQTLYILFPFCLGALMARTNFVERTEERLKHLPRILLFLILVAVVVLRYFLYSGAFISFYAAIVITFATIVFRNFRMLKFLLFRLGKASIYMWMIHAWICWYLLKEETYSIGNPLLIFISVTVASFILAAIYIYAYKITKQTILWLKKD